MVDISAIAGLANSLKIAGDLTKAAIGLRDAQMIQGKVIELQGVILSAQSSAMAAQHEHFSLIGHIRDLEEEMARLKTWDAEKQRYELESIPPGVVVYRLKAGMENGEPAHKICATCYQQGVKSFLHTSGEHEGLSDWKCPKCGFSATSGKWVNPMTDRGETNYF